MIRTESGLGQGPDPSPEPTCGPGVAPTLRREDQVRHPRALHHVSCHQEAAVSLGLAS